MAGPWEKYAVSPLGGQVLRPANPLKQQKEVNETTLSGEDVTGKRYSNQKTAAELPYAADKARAERDRAVAEARTAQIQADEKQASADLDKMGPNSQVHGDEYLRRFVPPEMWNTVKAYARGDLGSRVGGLSTSMLPIIQHAMNYDPTTSGVNFAARVKMQGDLADKAPGSAGGSLQAAERMLLHGREVLRAGQQLGNFNGVGSLLNYPKAAWESATHDPELAHFSELARNYAPEAQKAIALTAGGVGERQERQDALSGSASPQSIAASLQADAKQAFDAMAATNNRYKRIMGRDITDMLSPEAKAAYNEIMAGGYDAKGKPLHPVAGYHPFDLEGGAGGSEGGSGPGTPPLGPLATGGTKFTPDEPASRLATELVRSGMSDEQVNAALQAGGFGALQPDSIKSVREYLKQNPGFKGVVPGVGKFEDTNWLNNIADSTPGTLIGNAMVSGSAGLPVLLGGQGAAEALQAANNENPKSALVGSAIGGITPSIGAGKLLGLTKLAPWMAANPGAAGLAGDALYGTTYGFNTAKDGEGLQGATLGALGGVVGNRLGAGASKLAGGVMSGVVDPSVQYLKSRGVPMTGGQMLGGWAKSLEDKATSVPILGDLISERRKAGLNALNDAAFQEAGDAIGYPASRAGAAGVADLKTAAGRAYDNATSGVTVPLDAPFGNDMVNVMKAGNGLPDDLANRFNLAMENRVKPAVDSGQLTGADYQQAIRGLKGYKAEAPKPGFEQDYRDALSGAQDALTGVMTRNGGDTVVSGLQKADQTYRMTKILEDAVKRARNGSRSGEAEVFTPSQLNDAAVANRFSGNGTDRPFYDLGKAGQDVLPSKYPDSGTAGRLLAYGLGAGVLGGAGGAEYHSSGDVGNTGTAAAGILALSLLNTKGGQKAAEKLLLERPDIMRSWGQAITNRVAPVTGMLGRGGGATYLSTMGGS